MFSAASTSPRAFVTGPCLGLSMLISLVACAGTAGRSHYEALTAREHRPSLASLPLPAPVPRDDVARKPFLERAAFVRAVLARNPSIESARQGWRAALARVRQAGSFEAPMVELELAPLSLASSRAPLGYQLAVSQTLPWFGKRSLDATIAAAEAGAARSDFESIQRDLALTALNLYDRYFVAQRSLEINAQHVELMHALRDAATAQLSSGRGSAADALQAGVELAHMEHDAVTLASERDVVAAQMNELLHRAPGEPLPPPPRTLPTLRSPEVATERAEPAAVGARHDILAVHQRAQAAGARAERAERDAHTEVTVSTTYNSMWEMPEHRWMVGLGLSLPIFSGKRAGMAEEARATQAQLQSEAARLTDAARTQVFVASKQLQESAHVLRLFDTRLLPIARERIDAARAGFVTGQASFTAVVEAERGLRSTELDYQRARAEYAGRRGMLERALGEIPGLHAGDAP